MSEETKYSKSSGLRGHCGSILSVNIGNTNVQMAEWADGSFGKLKTVPTKEFSASMLPAGIPCAAASVVPALDGELSKRDVFLVKHGCRLPFTFAAGVNPSTIGADRLANAAALVKYCRLPALCADFGTAVTFEIVNHKKEFCGGVIMPGRSLMRRALNSYTAKLPLIDMYGQLPESFPGTNTVDAMRFGTDMACVGAVKEFVSAAGKFFAGQPLTMKACGGDAPFFIGQIEDFSDGGIFFTLSGVIEIWSENQDESQGLRDKE